MLGTLEEELKETLKLLCKEAAFPVYMEEKLRSRERKCF